MNPISLMHLQTLLLPSPRSHWSATRPRSKTQPTALTHTQRKHTRHDCWLPKTVRPVSETGQTASVGLSLTQAGETGQTGLANQSDRFCPETLQKPQNHSRAFPHLNKRSHEAMETSLLKTISRQPTGRNRSDRFGKPVRPIFAWTVEKNTARGSTPPNPTLNLPNRSTDLNKTLGILGTPHEESIAMFNPIKTRPKRRNQGNPAKSTSNQRTQETPNSSTFTHGFGNGITAQRTTKGSHKFPPSNPQIKVPKITQRNHQEKAPKITTKNNRAKHIQTLRNHAESSIHETKVHTRSTKPPNHPSLSRRSLREALKLDL
jgi:hypothetical protein